jgi:peptide deformylase
MLRKILRFPHPLLRKKAKAVTRVTKEIVKLVDDMIQTMHAAPGGVGLAAPQVGESVRVIVADMGEGPIAVVNPKIVKKSGRQTIIESCLSLIEIQAPVTRAEKVVLEGLDRAGRKINIKAEGFLATVFQHEVDHLDGYVFIDRVKDPSLIKHVESKDDNKEDLI